MKARLALLCLLFVGCTENALQNQAAENAPRQVVASGPTCAATGTTCVSSTECCEGTCEDNYYLETFHTCAAPLPNGSYCTEARECASVRCRDYVCAATTCSNADSACGVDADCCDGTFCENFTYAAWVCRAKLDNGGYCYGDSQCMSGHCRSYVCVAS